MNTTSAKTANRIFYLDLLRTIGCLSVVLLHVSSNFTLEPYGSMNYLLGVILDGASQFAVPLFVMISGALYLNEDYSFSTEKMTKHIKKMVLFFLGWSLLFTLIFRVLKNILARTAFSASSIIIDLLEGPYHLWFIPMIIGLYLITPILRLWVKKENKRHVEYFLLIGFVFSIVFPFLEFLVQSIFPDYMGVFESIHSMHFSHSVGYVFYFVLGWHLHQFDVNRIKPICCFGLLGLLLTICGTIFFSDMDCNASYFSRICGRCYNG